MDRFLKTMRFSLVFLAVLLALGCRPIAQHGPLVTGVSTGPNAPRFDGVFAVSSMWFGKIWEIFVAGSDPDGDMDYIWAEVSQLGGHMWDQHLIRLKGSNQARFKGVITLPTPSFHSRTIWETLRVTLRIRDRAGHYSDPVVLEVELGKPTLESIPDTWLDARRNRLGVIFFDFDLDRAEAKDFETRLRDM
ncbi:MAG: hypothetical protein WHS46_13815 [Desulfosoma sp.]